MQKKDTVLEDIWWRWGRWRVKGITWPRRAWGWGNERQRQVSRLSFPHTTICIFSLGTPVSRCPVLLAAFSSRIFPPNFQGLLPLLDQFFCVQVPFYKTLCVPAKVSPQDQGNYSRSHIGNIIYFFFHSLSKTSIYCTLVLYNLPSRSQRYNPQGGYSPVRGALS